MPKFRAAIRAGREMRHSISSMSRSFRRSVISRRKSHTKAYQFKQFTCHHVNIVPLVAEISDPIAKPTSLFRKVLVKITEKKTRAPGVVFIETLCPTCEWEKGREAATPTTPPQPVQGSELQDASRPPIFACNRFKSFQRADIRFPPTVTRPEPARHIRSASNCPQGLYTIVEEEIHEPRESIETSRAFQRASGRRATSINQSSSTTRLASKKILDNCARPLIPFTLDSIVESQVESSSPITDECETTQNLQLVFEPPATTELVAYPNTQNSSTSTTTAQVRAPASNTLNQADDDDGFEIFGEQRGFSSPNTDGTQGFFTRGKSSKSTEAVDSHLSLEDSHTDAEVDEQAEDSDIDSNSTHDGSELTDPEADDNYAECDEYSHEAFTVYCDIDADTVVGEPLTRPLKRILPTPPPIPPRPNGPLNPYSVAGRRAVNRIRNYFFIPESVETSNIPDFINAHPRVQKYLASPLLELNTDWDMLITEDNPIFKTRTEIADLGRRIIWKATEPDAEEFGETYVDHQTDSDDSEYEGDYDPIGTDEREEQLAFEQKLELHKALDEAFNEMMEGSEQQTEEVVEEPREVSDSDDEMDWSWDVGTFFRIPSSKDETSPSPSNFKEEFDDSDKEESLEDIEARLGFDPTVDTSYHSPLYSSSLSSSGNLTSSNIELSPSLSINEAPQTSGEQDPWKNYEDEDATNPELPTNTVSGPSPKENPQLYLLEARSLIRQQYADLGLRNIPDPTLSSWTYHTRIERKKPRWGNLARSHDTPQEEEEEVEGVKTYQVQIGSNYNYHMAQKYPSNYPSRLRKELLSVEKGESIKRVIRGKWPEYMTMEETSGGHFFVVV